MDDRIIELLYRNLQDVFGEGDAARRRAAIENLYIEDCVLCVPPGVFVGHDALDKFAGDLRATHPDFVGEVNCWPLAVLTTTVVFPIKNYCRRAGRQSYGIPRAQ